MKAYYPRALELFSKVTQPITLAFLKAYPTPQGASGLSLKGLKCFLREHRYTRPERVEELFKILKQPQMRVESWLVRAKSRHMLALVALLECYAEKFQRAGDLVSSSRLLQHNSSRL